MRLPIEKIRAIFKRNDKEIPAPAEGNASSSERPPYIALENPRNTPSHDVFTDTILR